jgi:hypothetical protein
MSYRVWEPTPPKENLQLLSDQELKIFIKPGLQQAVWNLSAIQQSLRSDPPMKVVYSTRVEEQMSNELKWDSSDARKFICELTRGRYEGSSWCYVPQGNTPYAADVYRMGYNRFQGKENQRHEPWTYIKFAMIGRDYQTLYIFSAHPEGQF